MYPFNDKENNQFDLISFGEVLIDNIKDTSGKIHQNIGGSPSNLMANMHQLGAKVAFVGSLGNDLEGLKIKAYYQELGLDQTFLNIVSSPTTQVDINQSQESPVPTFRRGADYQIIWTETLKKALISTKIFHFSYWPLTRQPALNTLRECLRIAKQNKTFIGFDPNVHQALLHEESIQKDEFLQMMRQVDIIKPSLDDAERLFGPGLNASEYMDQFEALDIPYIVMTLGAKGLLLSDHKVRTLIPSTAKKVVDTTGAGDAFLSGFYMSLLNQIPVVDACILGQKVSALVLKKVGASIKLPPYDTLMKKSI